MSESFTVRVPAALDEAIRAAMSPADLATYSRPSARALHAIAEWVRSKSAPPVPAPNGQQTKD